MSVVIPADHVIEDGIHVLESMICHATWRLGRTIYPGLEEHGVEAIPRFLARLTRKT